MPFINGIDTTLIAGLGQIGVGTGSAPIIYPSGGLVINFGLPRTGTRLLSGYTYPTASFYSRPPDMASASLGTSTWTKIVGNTVAAYLLSSSGELYSMGVSSYSGNGLNYTLAKVTTGSSGWTDIAAGTTHAIGICDSKLFGIGLNSNGQFGRGDTTAALTNFVVINNNTWWTKVSCGSAHSTAISGSGGSGSMFFAGNNSTGRTGQNTTSGNTTTWTQGVGRTGSIFTDTSCGDDFTLAISGGSIYGCGDADNYVLGNNSVTDQLTMSLCSAAVTYSRVFAFTEFSKAIDTSGFHYHAGNENYTRGDGNASTTVFSWTRLNTTGELATGWQNFFSNNNGQTSYGVIGIKDNRPWYIGTRGSSTDWFPNRTWTDYTSSLNEATWLPFVSRSVNVSCSAGAFYGSAVDPTILINLTPTS
jgi:hypothetical protein